MSDATVALAEALDLDLLEERPRLELLLRAAPLCPLGALAPLGVLPVLPNLPALAHWMHPDHVSDADYRFVKKLFPEDWLRSLPSESSVERLLSGWGSRLTLP